MSKIFEYNDIVLPENSRLKISPSQISKFFEYPRIWYEENMLGITPEIQGSTSMLLGTVLHKIYELVTLSEKVSKDLINEELDKYIEKHFDLPIDINLIKELYPVMAEVTVNEYIIPSNKSCKKVLTEYQMYSEISEGIYLGGTCDRIEINNSNEVDIVDYKNVGTKPSLDTIPFNYKIQLLSYAYLYNKLNDVKPTRITLVYSVRPTKTLPARCYKVSNVISDDDWKLIEDTLTLIADTVTKAWNEPDLIYLLFKSMNLKLNNNN